MVEVGSSDKADSDFSESVEEGRYRNGCVKFFVRNWFMLATVVGVAVGFAIAFGVRVKKPDEITITWIEMPGELYLRVLNLTILPLIFANIFTVIATLEPKKNGRISLIGLSYVVCANLVGSLIGTACTAIIKPGSRAHINGSLPNVPIDGSGLSVSDVFRDILFNLFPNNIIGVTLFQFHTEVVNQTTNSKIGNPTTLGTNTIGVLFCAIVFGAAANAVGSVAAPLVKFFEALSAIVTKLMSIFLLLTPIGVCFMVAGSVIGREDIQSDFAQLGLFIVTVLAGLLVYSILIVLVLWAASGKNPLRLLKYSLQPFLICFATTSTTVAMGEMYAQLDKYGCNQLASRFVVPVCAAMKGDGPGIFITSACMFIAQQAGVEVDPAKIIFIILITFASTLAIPNIPSASMVLVVTVLSSIGLPNYAASILFAIEWFLDRCRSGVSGLSVMYIAATTSALYERIRQKQEDDVWVEQNAESSATTHHSI